MTHPHFELPGLLDGLDASDPAIEFLTPFNECTLGVVRFTQPTPWERHPGGDELLHVLFFGYDRPVDLFRDVVDCNPQMPFNFHVSGSWWLELRLNDGYEVARPQRANVVRHLAKAADVDHRLCLGGVPCLQDMTGRPQEIDARPLNLPFPVDLVVEVVVDSEES